VDAGALRPGGRPEKTRVDDDGAGRVENGAQDDPGPAALGDLCGLVLVGTDAQKISTV
jgi:hypothetical protein